MRAAFKTHIAIILFVTVYVASVFITYKQYGITSDEEFRYKRGAELLHHFLTSKPLQTSVMPTIEPDIFSFYTMSLNVFNPRSYYEIFHLLNMLFATLVLIGVYGLVYIYTKNSFYSLLGPLFIILTPSFSGHFAANPIDMPFASVFTVGILLLYLFRKSAFSFKKILALGVTFWLVQCVRPLGFQIYLLYVFMVLLHKDPKQSWSNFVLTECKTLFLIFIVANFLMVITWPYIAINYFKNLPGLLLENAHYSKWDNTLLFMGKYIQFDQRPWYYLFVYLGLTLPVYILSLFFVSLFKIKNKLKIFILGVVVLNLVLYLVLNPVIYNGMRHFLFLVPFLVILSCFGLWDLLNLKINRNFKLGFVALLLINLLSVLYNLIHLFPYQYAYYNEFSGGIKNVYTSFETEYWGAMYKKSAIFIRDNLSGKHPEDVKVYSCNVSYAVDYYSFKKFATTVDRSKADYIICDFPEDKKRGYTGTVVHTDYLDGVPFMLIRKNPNKVF